MSDTGLTARWISWTPYLLSVLRISTAFLSSNTERPSSSLSLRP